MKGLEVSLLHVQGTAIGYARYGSMLHEELTKLGVDVYDRADEKAEHASSTPTYLLTEEGQRRFKRTNIVAYVSVPTHCRGWWDGQTPIISTMWEATKLPESFRENLHEFDTCIVPSDQNVELFGRYHPNVKKVPLGIDPAVWHPTPRPTPTTHFDFLIGGSGARKGTDLAYKAFRKLWPTEGSWGDGPEPRLIFKSYKPEDFYGRGITRVAGRISAEEETALYASAHCYLQPSRGEGFGLQPLQAIAQGCPTILTDAHGHADFAHLGYGLSTTLSKAAYFIYGDAGEWWEPSLDDLCDRMRFVYDNYEVAVVEAARHADEAVRRFTWENTARQFIEAIGPERMAAPYSGDATWVTPTAKLYHVRVDRPWKADIAGSTYFFEPGADYHEPADVKRILFDAGLLDVACLEEDDLGLAPHQVASLGLYRAEHEHCPVCRQRLGSGTTRADELIKEMV